MTDAVIRKLGASDLLACIDLVDSRQRLPEVDKWRLLFDLSRVHGAERDDELGGTVVSTALGVRACTHRTPILRISIPL